MNIFVVVSVIILLLTVTSLTLSILSLSKSNEKSVVPIPIDPNIPIKPIDPIIPIIPIDPNIPIIPIIPIDPVNPHKGSPTLEQLSRAEKVLNDYSKMMKSPFVMYVNYTDKKVVAKCGAGNGIIPCVEDIKNDCKWGSNYGKSKIVDINDPVVDDNFDNGINQSYAILNPNMCWLITIPMNEDLQLNWVNGNPINDGTKGGTNQNMFFTYGVTGEYYDTTGKLYKSYESAINNNKKPYELFPKCESNNLPNLAPQNQTQFEINLFGESMSADISSVDGVSRPFFVGFYDSTTGQSLDCKSSTIPNTSQTTYDTGQLYCNYDLQGCDFPDFKIDDGKYIENGDENGRFSCLQPGKACNAYLELNDSQRVLLSELWGGDIEDKFTFTDSFGTTWNKDGCKPGTKFCSRTLNNLTYSDMVLKGGSCDILNGGNLTLDGIPWFTGSKVPEKAKHDYVWTKYFANCGSNFGSVSDRLRMCKYEVTDNKCPIIAGGSCLDLTNHKDSWASDVLQKYCEGCHNKTCGTYCQSYDDYVGTIQCPNKKGHPPSVLLMTYLNKTETCI